MLFLKNGKEFSFPITNLNLVMSPSIYTGAGTNPLPVGVVGVLTDPDYGSKYII